MDNSRIQLHCTYYYDNFLSYLKVSVFPDRVFLIELPVYDELLSRLIGSICAFATAVNMHSPNIHVNISSDFLVPRVFHDLVSEYNHIQNYQYIHYENVDEKYDTTQFLFQFPMILLFSGGKDSTRKLIELAEEYGSSNIRCLYICGPLINAEFLDEFEAARNVCQKLNVRLITLTTWYADYTSRSLRVRLRSIWREMLLLCLARQFSDRIELGIAYDKELNSDLDMLRQSEAGAINFAASTFCLDSFAAILNAKINIAPDELDNYRFLKTQYPEIFKLCRSCYNPRKPCNPKNNWANTCSKCRTFEVYDQILAKKPLKKHQFEFIRSHEWVGDISLRLEYLHQPENNSNDILK